MPYKILLVDDDPAALNAYFLVLVRSSTGAHWKDAGVSRDDVQVLGAKSYVEAIDVLSSDNVDVLIVDLKIRGPEGQEMGGLNLIDESRRLDMFRPNLVLTGFGTMELAIETYQRGIFAFIPKVLGSDERLVEEVQRALSAREERLVRQGNPFSPISGSEPTFFGGRTGELELFETAVHTAAREGHGAHFLVLGDWGLGKSTLLKEYKKICQSSARMAAVVPLEALERGAGTRAAVRSLIEGIIRSLPLPDSRLRKLAGYFDSVGISILGSGLELTKSGKAHELLPQAFLHDSLLRLWEDLRDVTDVLVILVDDLDNFASVPEFVITLKQTLSMSSLQTVPFLVGLTATPGYWSTIVSSQRTHPLARFFKAVELELLAPDEFLETVRRSLAKGGVQFTQEVIDRAYRSTRGHPYEMQLLCYHLYENQISRHVTDEVWEKSLHAALLDMGRSIFRYWVTELTHLEMRVLRILAQHELPVTLRQARVSFAEQGIDVDSRKVAPLFRRLEERSLLRRVARDAYELHDLMFGAYLRSLPA